MSNTTPEQQAFIKANSDKLSIMEIAQQLKLQRNKVYRTAYALGVGTKANDTNRYEMSEDDTRTFDETQHENWLV